MNMRNLLGTLRILLDCAEEAHEEQAIYSLDLIQFVALCPLHAKFD